MAAYSKKVFIGFLDRDPKYSIPSAPKHAPGEISDLKPNADSVELRCLGSETAIVCTYWRGVTSGFATK